MMIRIGQLIGGGMTLSAAGVLVKVHSSSDETTKSKQRKFCPSQLPIYTDPEPYEYEVVPEATTTFHKYVSDVRKCTWKYLESVQAVTDRVKGKWNVAKAHTQDALAYIHEDSAIIPRVTIIAVAGLGGLVAGYRGGVLRKAVYSTIGATAGASVCYPHKVGGIAKQGWHEVRDYAYKTYDDSFGGSKQRMTPEMKKPNVEELKHDEKPESTPNKNSSVSVAKGDVGMSKAEDRDLYSTRGN